MGIEAIEQIRAEVDQRYRARLAELDAWYKRKLDALKILQEDSVEEPATSAVAFESNQQAYRDAILSARPALISMNRINQQDLVREVVKELSGPFDRKTVYEWIKITRPELIDFVREKNIQTALWRLATTENTIVQVASDSKSKTYRRKEEVNANVADGLTTEEEV